MTHPPLVVVEHGLSTRAGPLRPSLGLVIDLVDGVIMHGATPTELAPIVAEHRRSDGPRP